MPAGTTVLPNVITATGGVSGTFSTVTNNTPILQWQAIYHADAVDLQAVLNYANYSLHLSPNQWQVGNMLNGVAGSATGDLKDVLNVLASLPTAGAVGEAYRQISPDKAAALSTLAFAGANLQIRNLSQRITNLRFGGLETGGMGSLPGAFNLNYSRAAGLMLAYNSSNLAGLLTSEKRAEPAGPESRWGVYLDPALILGAQRLA